MKTILLIAFYFPPYASSGAWRPYFFAKHLAASGWRLTVLTIREEDCIGHESGIEIPLPGTIEIRTRFFELRGWVEKWGRRVWPASGGGSNEDNTQSNIQSGRYSLRCLASDLVEEMVLYPDNQVGWIINAVRAGRKAGSVSGCDVIYATGTPWSSLLAGTFLKLLLRRPLLVEFRDPWYGNPYHRRKFRLLDVLDLLMERWVAWSADRVITLTKELGEAMKSRHGLWLGEKLATVTNGYEERIQTMDDAHASLPSGHGQFRIIHAGKLYGKRDVRPLFEALLDLLQAGQLSIDDIRLDLIGEVELIDPKTEVMLKEFPLSDVVRISPRIPFTECQQRMEASDLLLIIQPDAPLQIPRKLFDYLAFDKPILTIAAGGATANLIRNECLGEVVANEREDIREALACAYRAFRVGNLKGPQASARSRFDNAVLAKKIGDILTELIQTSEGEASRQLAELDEGESCLVEVGQAEETEA